MFGSGFDRDEENARLTNQQTNKWLHALQGQLAPNYAGIENPVKHLAAQSVVGFGGLREIPNSAYIGLRGSMDDYNRSQDRASIMMAGPEGEAARQRMHSFMQALQGLGQG